MARQINKDGLICYLDGKNNSSETTYGDRVTSWYDISGNSNYGIISVHDLGRYWWKNNFLFFGDSEDRNRRLKGMTLAKKITFGNEFTCEVLFIEDFEYSAHAAIPIIGNTIYKSSSFPSGVEKGGFLIFTSTYGTYKNTISCQLGTGNNSFLYMSTPIEEYSDNPYLITLTIKDNNAYLYINGQLKTSIYSQSGFNLNASTIVNGPETGRIAIGDVHDNNGNYLNNNGSFHYITYRNVGQYGSIRIYNRALSDNEIYYNYIAEMEHSVPEQKPTYPEIPIIRPDGSIIEPVEDGYVSRVAIGNEELYNIKDTKARTTKLDKYKDEEVYGLVSFINGIQIDVASIRYDPTNNTVVFK